VRQCRKLSLFGTSPTVLANPLGNSGQGR
jgi:hypothetical protein